MPERSNNRSPIRPLRPKVASPASFRSSPGPRIATTCSSTPPAIPSSRKPLVLATLPSTPGTVASENAQNTRPANISPNVTPRSYARQSKAHTLQSTPTALPNDDGNSKTRSAAQTPTVSSPGGSISSFQSGMSSRPFPEIENKSSGTYSGGHVISQTPNIAQRATNGGGGQIEGQMFFHADDGPSQNAVSRPTLHKKQSSFVYADGRREESTNPEIPFNHSESKYGAHSAAQKSYFMSPGIGGIGGISSQDAFDDLSKDGGNEHSPHSSLNGFEFFPSVQPGSPSPSKSNVHLTYRKGASQIVWPNASTGPSSPTTTSFAGAQNMPFDPQNAQHNSSFTYLATTQTNQDIGEPRFGSNDNNSKKPRAFTSISTTNTGDRTLHDLSFKDVEAHKDTGQEKRLSVSSPLLGARPPGSTPAFATDTQEQHAELDPVAEARKARKMLDLEISNSSLLAINRSLEREVRKQKTELRRLRRISRNTSGASWMSDTTTLSGTSERDDDEYELPGLLGADDNGSEGTSDRASLTEEAMSPTTTAQHDAKYFRQDQKRLQLDLSKHKEILVDSQKMNVCLKRCLGMTDRLIKDGGKALEYRVHVSEVEFGGRVLSPEEIEDRYAVDEEADSYFMNAWSRESERLSAASQNLLNEVDTCTDKDSGVDLDYTKETESKSSASRIPSATLSELDREMF